MVFLLLASRLILERRGVPSLGGAGDRTERCGGRASRQELAAPCRHPTAAPQIPSSPSTACPKALSTPVSEPSSAALRVSFDFSVPALRSSLAQSPAQPRAGAGHGSSQQRLLHQIEHEVMTPCTARSR